jgi:hypothetical protein
MKRGLFILISLLFLSTLSAEQSLQEKLGIVQSNDYVQLEMPNGKSLILYKARVHRAQLIGTPVTYDKKKKKYVIGTGNSPSYYANRITKVSAFDIKQKPKK